MAKLDFSWFNIPDCPKLADYTEFIMYAGTSGMFSQYDEKTKTIKLIFTRTPSFHPVETRVESINDIGAAQFALLFQNSSQLRFLAKRLNKTAQVMDMMQSGDFSKEDRDLMMGRILPDEIDSLHDETISGKK